MSFYLLPLFIAVISTAEIFRQDEDIPAKILGLFEKSLKDKIPSNIINLSKNNIEKFLRSHKRVFLMRIDSTNVKANSIMEDYKKVVE